MNKQAVAFLTMFSLILMLSVYYVSIPSDTTQVMKEEVSTNNKNNNNKTVKNNTSKITHTEASTLQKSINDQIDKNVNVLSNIIANKASSEVEKQKAIANLETLKISKNEISQLSEAINKIGYNSAIEINNGACKIIVFDQAESQEIVKKVMKIAFSNFQQKYLIEVAFK